MLLYRLAGPFMSSCSDGDITLLLHAWSNGKSDVLEDLIPLIYDELYLTAKRCMSR